MTNVAAGIIETNQQHRENFMNQRLMTKADKCRATVVSGGPGLRATILNGKELQEPSLPRDLPRLGKGTVNAESNHDQKPRLGSAQPSIGK